MNKITILAIGAVFVASILAITALEVEAKPPSNAICPAENVQHWLNLRVVTSEILIHPTEPDLPDDVSLLMQLSRVGSELYLIDLRQQIVADRFNELGYTQTDGTPVDKDDISNVNTLTIEYSTICAEN